MNINKRVLIAAVFAAMLASFASAPALSSDAPPAGQHIGIDLHHMIPMRDGVHLAATIWKPGDMKKPLPVVLVMTPYITDETQARAVKFAQHGYVYVSVDVRGRGTSEGKFTPLYGNGPDGVDVIKWLVKQPWCDGRVVTRGGSYRGMDQWQIIAEHPAHLAAAVPTAAVYPGYDFPQPKGIFMSYMAQWLAYTSGQTGQDNLFADGAYWQTQFIDAYEKMEPFYKLADLAGTNRAAFLDWLAHPAYDDYWAGYNPKLSDYAKIDIPILTITGYFDGDQRGALRYYHEFMANATDQARARHYMLIGPWSHHGTREPSAKLGGLTFPKNSVLDIDQLHIAFFDWVLKGKARPGILSDRVNYYVMGAGVWRHAPSLDALSDHSLRLYLTSPDSAADDVFHSGRLVRKLPGRQGADTFIYDPRERMSVEDLMRQSGDGYLVNPSAAYQPHGLVYHSDPLRTPMTIAGAMHLIANISLNVPDTDIFAEIDAVLPSGRTLVLGQDYVRARFRRSLSKPVPVTPGAVEPYRFDGFHFTVRQLPKGARLRVVLAPLNLPAIEKNYNTGGRPGYEKAQDAKVATVAVHLDPQHPSFLDLPLAPPTAAEH